VRSYFYDVWFACESGIGQIIAMSAAKPSVICVFLSRGSRNPPSFQTNPGRGGRRCEEEELSNFFRNESWVSRGAARACLLYTGLAISYGRRSRPIMLTRLTRAIQSANARGGLRLRSLTTLRAKSPNNARWEFREICVHCVHTRSINVSTKFLSQILRWIWYRIF